MIDLLVAVLFLQAFLIVGVCMAIDAIVRRWWP